MYCPNCNAPLEASALSCYACDADFGELSAWRPTSHPTSRPQPIFSGEAKMSHAFPSILIFSCVGPPVGLAIMGIGAQTRMMFDPFALIGAYAIGGPPASFAGVFFGLLSLGAARFAGARVGPSIGLVLGAAAGFFGVAAYAELIIHKATGFGELSWLGSWAGGVSGLLSGWLTPIGRRTLNDRSPSGA
jgi:hypothetical protein